MGRKGVDCGCGAREDILDRLAALRQRVEVLETEINQVESQFPDVLRDVRSAEASAVSAAESAGASAESAGASAEIVEGYDDRLGAVEQGVIDVNDYAEAIGDDVSALDTEIHTTRPYMTTNTEQTITAKKHIPTATVNDDSDVWVNKAFVQATDGRNNLVHNIGDEKIDGLKEFSHVENFPLLHNINGVGTVQGMFKVLSFPYRNGDHVDFEITSGTNNIGYTYIRGFVRCTSSTQAVGVVYTLKSNIGTTVSNIKWKIENNEITVYMVISSNYIRCSVRIISTSNYGAYYKTSVPPVITYGNEQPITVTDTHNFIEG